MEKYVLKSDFRGACSDLATERRRADIDIRGVKFRRDKADVGVWERLLITTPEGASSIGRPMGIYDTLCLPPICEMDCDEIEDAKNEVAKELCRLCDTKEICPEKILVVGLGNRALTPDALGTLAADEVRATMHIKREDERLFYSLECSEIAVLKPGVTTESGLSAADIVRDVCATLMPDVIFAIDALAAGSPERLGKTVQICDTGIHPASGIGRSRKELSKATLGAPVIGIGVPTVINSEMFIVENGEARAPTRAEGIFLCPQLIGDIVSNAARIIGGGINQAFGIEF